MSGHFPYHRSLPDAAATEAFAARIAPLLRPGDTLLLEGEIGAGKTTLARAIIQTLQSACGAAEEVPSPTFTLVQTYTAGDLEIWHCDLYRLSGPDDCVELGLEEAFEAALCLVEWPDRLEDLTPSGALRVTLAADPADGRTLTLHTDQPDRWRDVIDQISEVAQ